MRQKYKENDANPKNNSLFMLIMAFLRNLSQRFGSVIVLCPVP